MSLVVDQVARMVGSGSHWLDVHGLAQLLQVHELFVLGLGLFSHANDLLELLGGAQGAPKKIIKVGQDHHEVDLPQRSPFQSPIG